MAVTIVESPGTVTGGVDTHLDIHVAAAVDHLGGVLGVESFPAKAPGYRALLDWLEAFGKVMRVGVEGTGSYGAGLARFLGVLGVDVVEVDRPNRQERYRAGKSDPLDAVAAARAALSRKARGVPKSRDGRVEAIRVLMVARRGTIDGRIATINQLRHICLTADDPIRVRFSDLTPVALGARAAALKPRAGEPVRYATLVTIRLLGRRIEALRAEAAELDALLRPLITEAAPGLLGVFGVGYDSAAKLLVAAGDNPQRLRSEAAWAHMCGVAPIPASSGKTGNRFRLNRGGNREANSALYRVVVTRLSHHQPTKDYVARRLAEGSTMGEIFRMLKRYVAREVYRHLPRALAKSA
jgi:transposase